MGSNTIRVVYGSSMDQPSRDAMVAYSTDFAHRLALVTVPGAYLVEVFPIMAYLPEWLAPWKRWVNRGYREDTAILSGYVDRVEASMVRKIECYTM